MLFAIKKMTAAVKSKHHANPLQGVRGRNVSGTSHVGNTQNDGQNRSLRSLFWPSCAGFHPELSAAARSARDIGHLRVCAAHSSSLNPFGKKMQAFSNLRDFANPAHVRRHNDAYGRSEERRVGKE